VREFFVAFLAGKGHGVPFEEFWEDMELKPCTRDISPGATPNERLEVKILGRTTSNCARGILTMELDAGSSVYPYSGQRRNLP
jgi:hypothetical protein